MTWYPQEDNGFNKAAYDLISTIRHPFTPTKTLPTKPLRKKTQEKAKRSRRRTPLLLMWFLTGKKNHQNLHSISPLGVCMRTSSSIIVLLQSHHLERTSFHWSFENIKIYLLLLFQCSKWCISWLIVLVHKSISPNDPKQLSWRKGPRFFWTYCKVSDKCLLWHLQGKESPNAKHSTTIFEQPKQRRRGENIQEMMTMMTSKKPLWDNTLDCNKLGTRYTVWSVHLKRHHR